MNMTEHMTAHTLTAQDTRALNHADHLCFDHLADGTGQIRAIRRADRSSSGFEETHIIPAHSSRLEAWDRPAELGDTAYTGFVMIQSALYDDISRTLVRHLRAGSQFAFIWWRGNSSPVTKEAGMVRDELRIRIQRKGSKVADTFLVSVQVGYDNSARMVKVARS